MSDILMSPIALALGRVDFTNLFAVLRTGSEQSRPYLTLEAALRCPYCTSHLEVPIVRGGRPLGA